MTTGQKDAVPQDSFDCPPYSNIAGDEWIVETTDSGHKCIEQFADVAACIAYVNSNISEWDEFHDI